MKKSLNAFPPTFIELVETLSDAPEQPIIATFPDARAAASVRYQFYGFKKFLRTLTDPRGTLLCEQAEGIVVSVSGSTLQFASRSTDPVMGILEAALREATVGSVPPIVPPIVPSPEGAQHPQPPKPLRSQEEIINSLLYKES